MAETLIENQICSACGADVRAGSLFCYNCGGAVSTEIRVFKTESIKTPDEIHPSKNVAQKSENNLKLEAKPVDENPKETDREPSEKSPENPNIQKDAKLKSAATMRGKPKLVEAQKIEVTWEERESAPNVWFVLVALFLAILAAVILFLAIRLK